MSEYAVVKSFLSCLSSSFVFSSNPGKDKVRLGAILQNVRQAIDYQGLSASTQELLHHVFDHLKSFEAEDIDSTELDFLIDGAMRNIGHTEDCGIRVFVERPSVLMALVMSYNLVLLSQYLVKGAQNCPNNAITRCECQKSTAEKGIQACEPVVKVEGEYNITSHYKAKKRSLLTAKKLIIHHEQLSSFKNTLQVDSNLKQENNCTQLTYSRKEILDCNSPLFPMPEFTASVWLMGIVKPPFHMITPPVTPTSPDLPRVLPGQTEMV